MTPQSRGVSVHGAGLAGPQQGGRPLEAVGGEDKHGWRAQKKDRRGAMAIPTLSNCG